MQSVDKQCPYCHLDLKVGEEHHKIPARLSRKIIALQHGMTNRQKMCWQYQSEKRKMPSERRKRRKHGRTLLRLL